MKTILELEPNIKIAQCHNCGVWFSYNVKGDVREDRDRDGVYLVTSCPKCNVGLTVGVK